MVREKMQMTSFLNKHNICSRTELLRKCFGEIFKKTHESLLCSRIINFLPYVRQNRFIGKQFFVVLKQYLNYRQVLKRCITRYII